MTAVEALAATRGEALLAHALPPHIHVATDSRTLRPGDAFLALRGARFDGHRFTAEARNRGATAVIVDDPSAVPSGMPAIVVRDTKGAYLALATAARRACGARVIAITGSAGKTTTKALLHQILRKAGAGAVAATSANENNEIGVSKLFLGLPPHTDIVVAEFGARHYGDISTLVSIALPDIAVLTNVGDAHLEIMGSRERLAETKWSIFSLGAAAILNARDTVSLERAPTLAAPPRWFAAVGSAESVAPANGRHTTVLRGRSELAVATDAGIERYPTHCALPGEHNRANVAAACAAAIAAGTSANAVAECLQDLVLPEGRYERTRIGDVEVIFDAYNASMAGMLATLDAFAAERAERRIAVLSSMAELGDGSASMHERVGAAAARSDLAALLVGGEYAPDLERGARDAGISPERVIRFRNNGEAVRWLEDHARAGDVVLLKGSRMYHLEEVVEGLREIRHDD